MDDSTHITDRRASGLTVRALAIGSLLVVLVNVAAPYSLYVVKSSLLASDYMPVGALFPFFVVVAVVNVVLKWLRPASALVPAELILIFMMALVGASVATYGLAGYLVSVIAAPYFFATPENQWSSYLHPYIPDWAVPSAEGEAMRWFFDGLPAGASIPWAVWIVPLFWWGSLLLVVIFVAYCTMAILRRQWVEHEKLLFPLVELPLTMVEGAEDANQRVPAFLKGRVFWAGFAVPLVIVLWNTLHYFSPFIPQIPLGGIGQNVTKLIRMAEDFPPIIVNLYPPIIGFSYLMNLDVLFSFWFFHVLALIQAGVYGRTGFSLGASESYSSEYDASMGWQSMGAFLAMVLWGLWMARPHLRAVLHKAWHGAADPLDDSKEMMPYRRAVLGVVLGTLYIAVWLKQLGLTWTVIAVLLPTVFIIYIGVSRIIAEGGLAFARGPMVAQTFTAYLLGSASIPPAAMTGMALSYAGFSEIKNNFMPAFAHCARLSEIFPKRRTVAVAAGVAILLGMAVAIPWTIWLGYSHGAYNFQTWIFRDAAPLPYNLAVTKMRDAFDVDTGRLAFLGIGAAAYTAINLLRTHFAWWSLHPIGLTLASSWPIKMTAFSLFVGWLCKYIIVRVGGMPLYRKARPFFLGLILGYFTGVACANTIDWIWFNGQGHWIYGLY